MLTHRGVLISLHSILRLLSFTRIFTRQNIPRPAPLNRARIVIRMRAVYESTCVSIREGDLVDL